MTRSKTSAAVVGRRLRRYLGALLAVGFGVTWWGFVPPAEVDAAPGEAVRPRAPEKLATTAVTQVAAMSPIEIAASHRPKQPVLGLVIQVRKPVRKVTRRPVRTPPPVIAVVEPVIDPIPLVLDPIVLQPVIAPPPVVVLPEPLPIYRIPIRTRPS